MRHVFAIHVVVLAAVLIPLRAGANPSLLTRLLKQILPRQASKQAVQQADTAALQKIVLPDWLDGISSETREAVVGSRSLACWQPYSPGGVCAEETINRALTAYGVPDIKLRDRWGLFWPDIGTDTGPQLARGSEILAAAGLRRDVIPEISNQLLTGRQFNQRLLELGDGAVGDAGRYIPFWGELSNFLDKAELREMIVVLAKSERSYNWVNHVMLGYPKPPREVSFEPKGHRWTFVVKDGRVQHKGDLTFGRWIGPRPVGNVHRYVVADPERLARARGETGAPRPPARETRRHD